MALLLNKMTHDGCQQEADARSTGRRSGHGDGPAGFDIGKRNYLAIRKILWSNTGMFINAEDVGGSAARSLYMIWPTEPVTVRSDRAGENACADPAWRGGSCCHAG
jgi:chemotaxis receptor (MCP) glutamine deamidase CheD